MNVLKILELNLGFERHRLDFLYYVLRKNPVFKTALIQDILMGKEHVNL